MGHIFQEILSKLSLGQIKDIYPEYFESTFLDRKNRVKISAYKKNYEEIELDDFLYNNLSASKVLGVCEPKVAEGETQNFIYLSISILGKRNPINVVAKKSDYRWIDFILNY